MEKTILEKLITIETYSLLAAKTMLTFEEAVIYTGIGKDHMYKLTSSRAIPYYKPRGKMLYFDKKELDSWMRQGRVATTEELAEQAIKYINR